MRRVILLSAILSILILPSSYAATWTIKNNSPIVQVVSYEYNYGKFFELKWRGSASIINKDGFIITNNHVVDDEKGGTFDLFNICISEDETQKPECNYTATLVARDTQKDIAILKINSKDIYGNAFDTSILQTITPDYTYTPNSGNQVTAIWYPWVGSETITKTQGIISGTSQYNNATYLKTDTLIAGGNSWWALVKDGKLVGIPTFWVGWGVDTSLGYALLISYAKDFINTNSSKKIQEDDTTAFNSYKRTIDNLNEKRTIDDDFIQVSFSSDYEISDYVQNRSVSFKPSKGNEEIPDTIGIGAANLPNNITSQDDFFYYIQKIWLYSKDYQKLKKVSLQWIDFFTPVSLSDSSGWDTSSAKIYFWKIGNKVVVLYGTFSSDQTEKIQKAQKNFDTFINKITFNTDKIKSAIYSFNLPVPWVEIASNSWYVLTESSWFAYIFPFGNLHEEIQILVSPLDADSWAGKSVSELYKTDTKDIGNGMKTLITFKWHNGYLYCSNSSIEYQEVYVDEKGNQLDQSSCRVRIYDLANGKGQYVLDAAMIVDRKDKNIWLTTLINFLNNNVKVEKIGKGETQLENIFENQNKIKFTDIQKQEEGFKNKLNLLVKYDLIKNEPTFNPYRAIKWGEFITFYTTRVYKVDFTKFWCNESDYKCQLKAYRLKVDGIDHSLAYLLDRIGIKLDSYVNQDKIDEVPTILDMIILWKTSPEEYSEEDIVNFTNLQKEPIYSDINKKIEEGFYTLYGNGKISLYDIDSSNYSDFLANKELYYTGSGNVMEQPYYTSWKLNLSKIVPQIDFTQYKLSYPVLTKASMIDFTTDYIDFWLYDSTLAEKKNTNVED